MCYENVLPFSSNIKKTCQCFGHTGFNFHYVVNGSQEDETRKSISWQRIKIKKLKAVFDIKSCVKYNLLPVAIFSDLGSML
jgi:hypothetical protein